MQDNREPRNRRSRSDHHQDHRRTTKTLPNLPSTHTPSVLAHTHSFHDSPRKPFPPRLSSIPSLPISSPPAHTPPTKLHTPHPNLQFIHTPSSPFLPTPFPFNPLGDQGPSPRFYAGSTSLHPYTGSTSLHLYTSSTPTRSRHLS